MARSCGQCEWAGAWLGLALAAGALGLAGCNAEAKPVTAETSKYRPAEAKPAVAATPAASEATAAFAGERATGDLSYANPPAVPSAPPTKVAADAATTPAANAAPSTPPSPELKQLLDFINKLTKDSQSPSGNNEQEVLQNFIRLQQQRLAACEQALELNPDAATRRSLLQAMYQIHRMFARANLPGARAALQEFAKKLAADPDAETARFGRYTLFDARISQLASQPLTEGKPILDEIKALIASEKEGLSAEALSVAQQALEPLMQNNLATDAATALELLAAAAAGNPQLAESAGQLKDSANMVRADLGGRLQDIFTGQPDAEKKLLVALQTLLAEVRPSADVLRNLLEIAQVLEATGHGPTALACFEIYEPAFSKAKDEALVKDAALQAASARKRLSLVGQPLTVEGLTLDGKPFDWSGYQGKVVLIDFWATSCQPCLEELPNIRANYDLFHAKGFEVVGVNLNTNAKDVKEFFALQGEFPWATVISPQALDGALPPNSWAELAMPAKCGVTAIPFLVLIGKDGKVDSLHVRGPKLKARLTALLGAPPLTEIPADPTTPAAAPAAPAAPPAAPTGKTGYSTPGRSLSPIGLMVAQALLVADDLPQAPAAADDPAINPYKAKPGLSSTQLIDYVLKMLDKPKTIQSRAGFGEAIVEACDRVLKADPPAKETELLVAAESKLAVLHREACSGNDAADKQLAAFVEELKDDSRPRIAREVAFYQLERKAIDAANLPLDQVPAVLKELQESLAKEKLTGKHLRLASSTVALINRLENGDEREKHFASFGGTFAKSSDKELARYGKKLAKKPAAQESDLVGKPLELVGTTAKGLPFAWVGYRGKVVVVDFWATWCGPCRREMPNVKAFYEKHKDRGLEVVGVSLDQDQEALVQYIEENQIPWETLAGDDTQQLAEKYGVRAIPTMMLVDKTGKIVGVAHNLAALAPLAEKLLAE